MKQKQEDVNKIRSVGEKIEANRDRIGQDISNLEEILDLCDETKERYKEIFVQISDRYTITHAFLNFKILNYLS